MSKNNNKDLCIQSYTFENKEYFEVTVQKRNKQGKMTKKKSRFTKTGNRITSKKAAEDVKYWLKTQIEHSVGLKSNYTWQNWHKKALDEMRKSGLKESTILNYDGVLTRWKDPAWDNKFISSFTKDDIYAYIHEYLPLKGASDWTRKNIYKRIHKILEMAVESGEIVRNPSKGIKVNAQTSEGLALTPGEVEILLKKAKAINHEYYSHWVLALMTGMRCGELYALRWSDIDFEAGVIHVVQQCTSKDGVHAPKSGKARPIDLSPELSSFLVHLKKKHGLFTQKMWSWKKEQEWCQQESRIKTVKTKEFFMWEDLVLPRIRSWKMGMQAKELKSFCRQIGIREIKFHDLRATHITNLLSNGVAISKVMKQVGHSQMSTTDGYHRLTGVQVKGVAQNLSYGLPEEARPENVIELFPKKA